MGMQTPVIDLKPQVILNTDESNQTSLTKKTHQRIESSSTDNKVFTYSVPFESHLKDSAISEVSVVNVKEMVASGGSGDTKEYYDVNYSIMKCLSSM